MLFSLSVLKIDGCNNFDAGRQLEEARKRGVSLEHPVQRVTGYPQLERDLLAAHESGHCGGVILHGFAPSRAASLSRCSGWRVGQR